MAKVTTTTTTKKKAAANFDEFEEHLDLQEDDSDLPEGFSRANPIDEAPLYWKPVVGATLQGELVGRYQRRAGEKGWYYQIKTTKPCDVRDSDKEDREAVPGEVVNVDERSGLSHLAKYVGIAEKRFEVFIKAKSKEPLKSNPSHTFWRFALGAREIG